MWIYCDTSALAKRYVQEAGRPALMRLLSGRRIVSSSVTPIELHSAFARRVRDGHLATVSLPRLWERVSEELPHWTLVTLSPDIVASAQDLVEHHPLRTLDAIHVASAQLFASRMKTDLLFVSADERQCEAAARLRLTVRRLAA
jgi:predicted nucleic acid-binding protein